jgi:hypothetical protein
VINNIDELKVGDKVYYQPEHYKPDHFENGIVKEIPKFPKGSLGYNHVRVVYKCGGNWDRYQDYTSALTNLEDLHLGWR